jgi:hypothetical protein
MSQPAPSFSSVEELTLLTKDDKDIQKHDAHIRSVAVELVLNFTGLALVVVTQVWSKSNFYLIGLTIPYVAQLAMLLAAVPYHGSWKREEFDLVSELRLDSPFQLCNKNPDTVRRVDRWKVVRNIAFLISILAWVRALWLWSQVLGVELGGFSKSYSGLSSCNANPGIPGLEHVYNPRGAFTSTNKFSKSQYYVTCVFADVTWANPPPRPFNYVAGYQLLPSTSTYNCLTLQPSPGFVNIGQCEQYFNVELSYPDKTQGVENARERTTTSSVKYCPGNMAGEVVCYDPTNTFLIPCTLAGPEISRVAGKPKKICPVCLNAYRQTSQLLDEPYGFDECPPYSPTQKLSELCGLCPGVPGGWLADEVSTTADTVVVFWLVTTVVWFYIPLKWIVFYLTTIARKPCDCVASFEEEEE